MSNKIKTKKSILEKLKIDDSSLIITSSEKRQGLDTVLGIISNLINK